MTNYLVGDFLIRIKNAYMASKDRVETPYSKLAYSVGEILQKEGLVKKISILTKKESPIKKIQIELLDSSSPHVFTEIKILSKPSAHSYLPASKVKNFREPGIVILTTSKGVMTKRDAVKNNIGGELLFRIY